MSGETDLSILFSSLKVTKSDDIFVFVTCAPEEVPDNLPVLMRFEETEGTSLILEKQIAEQFALSYEFESHMITLDVHSSLEAVGFMAQIASRLAVHHIPVNPVAGFYHDHLFVPADRVDEAVHILQDLAKSARETGVVK